MFGDEIDLTCNFDDEFTKYDDENDLNLNVKVGTPTSYTKGLGTSLH